MDSTISGQRTAAIRTHEAGFTLVRDHFSNLACTRVARFIDTADLPDPNVAAPITAWFFLAEHFSLGLEIGPDGRE